MQNPYKKTVSSMSRKGDLLFRGDLGDWMNNACLNIMGNGDPIAYREGYRRAAENLVRHVRETGHDQDFLVYPIVFLYRHHIELALKKIIIRTAKIIDHVLTEEEGQHLEKHRLDLLWRDLKPMLAPICKTAGCNPPSLEDIEWIDNYIQQLSEVDANSFSFRYTHTKKGGLSLPPKLTHINLRHFAEIMESLAGYFEGIDMTIEFLVEAGAETEAEYR